MVINIKTILSLLLALQLTALPFQGKAYIVYDCINDEIIESYNLHHIQSVASISKIMTAILVIENMNLKEKIIVDKTINKAYGSSIYLHIKDQTTVQDLLYGLMLRSGNDCALMLAKACGKTVERFVDMMNKKAQELNMFDTTFHNPSGLDEQDPGNLSSVHDMAILYDYCRNNVIFRNIVQTQTYKRLDGYGYFHNKNKLLSLYKYCIGGKTGYTKKAKRTLITNARKDNHDFVIVTLNLGNDFEFHKQKYIECFNKYKQRILIDKGVQVIEGQKYLIETPIYTNKDNYNKVNYRFLNGKIKLYKGDNNYRNITLTPYKDNKLFIMILKDLIYG